MLHRRALDAWLLESTSKELHSRHWKRDMHSQEAALTKNLCVLGQTEF